MENGKPEYPGKTSRNREENQLNQTHITRRARIWELKSGHIGGRRVTWPLRQPCFLYPSSKILRYKILINLLFHTFISQARHRSQKPNRSKPHRSITAYRSTTHAAREHLTDIERGRRFEIRPSDFGFSVVLFARCQATIWSWNIYN